MKIKLKKKDNVQLKIELWLKQDELEFIEAKNENEAREMILEAIESDPLGVFSYSVEVKIAPVFKKKKISKSTFTPHHI